jgi:hypothetical protein
MDWTHLDIEYFDEKYDEKQRILKELAKEEYERQLKEIEEYEQYRISAEPGEHYPDCAA